MIMDRDNLCQHQRRRWSFLSIVDNRSRAWTKFIWKTICSPCSMASTLHSTNKIQMNRNTATVWSQCCRRTAARTMMVTKSNCLRDSSSGFILRVYSHKPFWCPGCLPLEVLTYACLTRSFYPGFNDLSFANVVT